MRIHYFYNFSFKIRGGNEKNLPRAMHGGGCGYFLWGAVRRGMKKWIIVIPKSIPADIAIINRKVFSVRLRKTERLPNNPDSLTMKLFLFNFFHNRSTSPINHLLLVMVDFRIYVVDEIGVVSFSRDEGEGVCHLHQFTISGVGGDA